MRGCTDHFRQRCLERWGFAPSAGEVDWMVEQIRQGRALLLRSSTRRGGRRYLVEVRGHGREVVWFDAVLITALRTPPVPWRRVERLLERAAS